MTKHRYNYYVCQNCEKTIISLEIHEGVTPFCTKCIYCGGQAYSSFYTGKEGNLDANVIWYKPYDFKIFEPATREHLEKGGLIYKETREPLGPIKWQKQPNIATCLVTNFAIILDVPVIELIEQIGHYGMDVIARSLPEPYKRRGHHIQELIFACMERGYAVTEFQPLPVSQHLDFPYEVQIDWFEDVMLKRHGVLVGTYYDKSHSLAWADPDVLNPAIDQPPEMDDFEIRAFYAVTPYPKDLYK